jgi:hypothetical protein
MNTLAPSSRNQKRTAMFKSVPLFTAGVGGMMAGGTVWGFFGVVSVLLAVWFVNQALDTAQRTRDIERFYRTSPNFLTSPQPLPQRVSVSERARVFVRPAANELESIGG